METLVATVLIVVVFMITSLLLNSLFANSQKFKAGDKEAYLHQLQYRYQQQQHQQQQLSLPWYEETDFGEVAVFSEVKNGINNVVFELREKESNQYKRIVLVAEP